MNNLLFVFLLIFAILSPIENQPFHNGEKLIYDIYFRFLPAGQTTITTVFSDSGWVIKSQTNSNGFIDKIYPVRDQIISRIHTDSLYTLEYKKKISEGKYKREYYAQMIYQDSVIHSGAGDVLVNAPVYDLLAMIFYLRNANLEIGNKFSFRSFDNNKIIPITMKVFEIKNFETKLGKFSCFVLKPYKLKLGKKSKVKGGLEVWISNTYERLPVMIKSKLLFGSMNAKLIRVE